LELNLRARERPGPGLDSVINLLPQGVLTVVLCQNGCSGESSFKVKTASNRTLKSRKKERLSTVKFYFSVI